MARCCTKHGTPPVEMELVRSLLGFLYYRCPVPGCSNARSVKLFKNGARVKARKNLRSYIKGDKPEDFNL